MTTAYMVYMPCGTARNYIGVFESEEDARLMSASANNCSMEEAADYVERTLYFPCDTELVKSARKVRL